MSRLIQWVAQTLGLRAPAAPVKRPRDPEPEAPAPPQKRAKQPPQGYGLVPSEIRQAFPLQTHRRNGKLVFSGVTRAPSSGLYTARAPHPITQQQVVLGSFSDKRMAALCVAMVATARSDGEVRAATEALRKDSDWDWDWAAEMRDRALSGAPTPEAPMDQLRV